MKFFKSWCHFSTPIKLKIQFNMVNLFKTWFCRKLVISKQKKVYLKYCLVCDYLEPKSWFIRVIKTIQNSTPILIFFRSHSLSFHLVKNHTYTKLPIRFSKRGSNSGERRSQVYSFIYIQTNKKIIFFFLF